MSRNSSTPSWIFFTASVCVWHDHAVGDRRRARGREAAHALDLDEAHAAHADRLHALVPAEARDVDAVLLRGLDQQLARLRLERLAVDGDGDRVLRRSGFGSVVVTRCAPASLPRRAAISSRKYLLRLAIGDTTLGPSGQIVVCVNGAVATFGRDAGADVEQQVEVLGPAQAVRHAVQHLLDPAGALAARRALAARLVREELREPPRDEQRVGGLVEHHDRARSRASRRGSAARSPCRAARRGARRCR